MKKFMINLLLVVMLGIFAFSAWQVYSYFSEIQAGESLSEELAQSAVVKAPERVPEVQQKDETEDPEETAEATEPPETAPVQVDFDVLWAESVDVVAWVYCEDTVINYPVVQTENNSDYLRRLLNGQYNSGGTIFIDYRNAWDFTDWNTVIYGHNMRSGTMFGCLDEYNKQSYYEEHPVWYIITAEKDYKVELIGGFVTPTNSSVYIFPMSQQEKNRLVETCREKSTFTSTVEVGEEDALVTFSTCTGSSYANRYVLVGVLRELARP